MRNEKGREQNSQGDSEDSVKVNKIDEPGAVDNTN